MERLEALQGLLTAQGEVLEAQTAAIQNLSTRLDAICAVLDSQEKLNAAIEEFNDGVSDSLKVLHERSEQITAL